MLTASSALHSQLAFWESDFFILAIDLIIIAFGIFVLVPMMYDAVWDIYFGIHDRISEIRYGKEIKRAVADYKRIRVSSGIDTCGPENSAEALKLCQVALDRVSKLRNDHMSACHGVYGGFECPNRGADSTR